MTPDKVAEMMKGIKLFNSADSQRMLDKEVYKIKKPFAICRKTKKFQKERNNNFNIIHREEGTAWMLFYFFCNCSLD
jgi:hypothetical protein